MGLGVVGGGVARVLADSRAAIAHQVGCPVNIKLVLVRSLDKAREYAVSSDLLTQDANDILLDDDISIVIEVMGGETPAEEYIRRAIRSGKHVVTANKEVMAKHGPELLAKAKENNVEILYEASVGGGIPLIGPFKQGLLANNISAIHAIINGTTNYILTKMASEGADLPVVLKEAQSLGYAEADPTNDVEGIDAAYKLAILSSLAFHTTVGPQDIYREGITKLTAKDFRYANELGYSIKLLAIAKADSGSIQVRVHPTFVPTDSILAKVDGVFNAVQVEGDLVGKVLFYGRGAGSLPTTSAVLADVIDLAQNIYRGIDHQPTAPMGFTKPITSVDEIRTRYYLRMSVADRPGVLGQIAQILGDSQISIASVIQKEADETAQSAEIVIMTHTAQEKAMRNALRVLNNLAAVVEIGNLIRVEDQHD
ncbi:MAG: homoserine dehydrogenase [Dehalococcoidia bacterium]|nr:homoserine dehydrogenase [Dehalococcoidia bacterium]